MKPGGLTFGGVDDPGPTSLARRRNLRKALIGAVAIPLTLGLLMPTSASGIDDINTKKIP